MDAFIAGLALMLASPLMVIVAIAVRLESRGGIFYRSRRVGKDGRAFTMYKFRTMRAGAEECLRKDDALYEKFALSFKLKNDPRVTRLGKFLRRTCLDELPQLFNVLRGDMSVVGPRPILPEESERVSAARLSVAPGLTGLWQVSGKSALPYEKKCQLDDFYARHRSVVLDVKIMLMTFPAIVRGVGFF
jgi:lipopolysaccharide/colanic/teichoic acid biosynthesis glycosyltransferase